MIKRLAPSSFEGQAWNGNHTEGNDEHLVRFSPPRHHPPAAVDLAQNKEVLADDIPQFSRIVSMK